MKDHSKLFSKEFTPKFFSLLEKGIPREQIAKDVLSGIIIGIISLPLTIAFAIASGVGPEKGLVTAILAGIIISLFGGSRVQIGGPTGAFIIIIVGIISQYGIDGLTIATLLAGVMLIIMGILRFGRLLKYFPYTVVVGFTSGIAVVLFTSQIKDLLGLDINHLPPDFFSKWAIIFAKINTINIYSVIIGVSTIIITLYFPKISNKIPGSLIAILLCTFCVSFFNIPVVTIDSYFGKISTIFPKPEVHIVDFETFKHLLQPALAIALLGGIESLLSAVVADGMIGGRHRSNMELIAQGLANIASSIFGGIPATGSIGRTATNIRNGGRTPIAGIVHSLVILIILLVAAPLAKMIPMACLAGILVVVAWNMSEVRAFRFLLKSNKYDMAVLLTTFLLTVIFDIVIAIQLGMVLAAFIFMKRMADATELGLLTLTKDDHTDESIFEEEIGEIPPRVAIFEINGPLFFGAAQKFYDTAKSLEDKYNILIIRMRNVPIIDATGLQRLREIVKLLHNRKVKVILSGVNEKIRQEILHSEFIEPDFIKPHIKEAIDLARQITAKK